MNISSNKPNSPIQNQLNYHSRKRGKTNRHKQQPPSPLIQQPSPSTIFIQSRPRSQTPTLKSVNHSLLSAQLKNQSHGQILILSNSSSEEMLILEKEQNNESSYEKQQDSLQLSISHPSQMTSYSKPSQNKSINIEQKDQKLLWINEEQFQKLILPQKQTQRLKCIIKEREQSEQFYSKKWYYQTRTELSNIQQMSSRAQDDSFYSNQQYQHQQDSKKPISPQSQPLRKMALAGGEHFRNIDQKSWITIQDDDCSSIIDQLENISENLEEDQPESPQKSKRTGEQEQILIKPLFSSQEIISLLDKPTPGLFSQKIHQLEQLKKEVTSQNVKHIDQIQWILSHEQNLLTANLTKQTRLLNTFTTILTIKTKIGQTATELQNQLLQPDQQILVNQYLLRKMAQLIKR